VGATPSRCRCETSAALLCRPPALVEGSPKASRPPRLISRERRALLLALKIPSGLAVITSWSGHPPPSRPLPALLLKSGLHHRGLRGRRKCRSLQGPSVLPGPAWRESGADALERRVRSPEPWLVQSAVVRARGLRPLTRHWNPVSLPFPALPTRSQRFREALSMGATRRIRFKPIGVL